MPAEWTVLERWCEEGDVYKIGNVVVEFVQLTRKGKARVRFKGPKGTWIRPLELESPVVDGEECKRHRR